MGGSSSSFSSDAIFGNFISMDSFGGLYDASFIKKKRKGEEEDSYDDYDDWIEQSRFSSWSDETIVEFFFLFFNNY